MLPDGTVLVGEFEETLGTQLMFSGEYACDSLKTRENASLMMFFGADDMGAAAAEDDEGSKRSVELQCHTDKKIRFRKQR